MRENCVQKHHSNLHREISETDCNNHFQKSNNVAVEQRILNSPGAYNSVCQDSLSGIRNQPEYMPVTLINGNTSIQSYAMLNNCSSCSYMCKITADKLKSTPKHSIDLKVHGAFSRKKNHSTLIKLMSQHSICFSALDVTKLPFC